MRHRRRDFLVRGGLAVAAASVPFSLLPGRRAHAGSGFGPLIPDPNPEKILDLPSGFTYRVLERQGDPMAQAGYQVPGRPDGMACFPGPDGTVVLMRNHECNDFDVANSPYQAGTPVPDEAYTESGYGGVTRVVVDASSFEHISTNLVLVGTVRNCAGGVAPWGWLSCEESTLEGHGWVFLCPDDADTLRSPVLIEGYGRFNHEAAVVDPLTYIAYLTEDESDSSFYRFVPDAMDDPFVGTLQALRVVDTDRFATTTMEVGDVVDVEWVDVEDPTAELEPVRAQAQAKGAAVFVRGEGLAFDEGAVYICSTSGGPVDGGQIFRLIDDGAGATLELLAQSTNRDVLDMPDNITVSPTGRVYMAEDGDGDQYVRFLDEEGQVCDFARNAKSGSELAGVCFSPDGRALFVNMQDDGLTLVVTGPFPGTDGDDGDGDTGAPDDGGSDSGSGGDDGDTMGGGETGSGDGADTNTVSDVGSSGAGTGSGFGDDPGCACDTDGDGHGALGIAAATAALRLAKPRADLDPDENPQQSDPSEAG